MGNIMDEKCSSLKVDTYSALQTTRYYLASSGQSAIQHFRREDVVMTPVDKTMCANIQGAYKKYNEYLSHQKVEQIETEKALDAPSQSSAPSKRKFKDTLDMVTKRARLAHAAHAGEKGSKN